MQVSQWVVKGGDNFYLHSEWKRAMDQAVVHAKVSVRRKQTYSIGRYYAYWPSIVRDFKMIYNSDGRKPETEKVLALLSRVASLNDEVIAMGEPFISNARHLGQILERTDADTPIGAQFDFANMDTLQCLVTYVMLLIIFNRVLHHLSILSGRPTLLRDCDHRALCRQIWMCIPYIRAMQGTGSILFAAPLYLSYEGASEEPEKEYLLDYIIQIAKRRGFHPRYRREVENFVLNTARSMTGQKPFDTTRFGK